MRLEEMSCIDCGVKKCDSKTEVAREEFPPFCVTTHLDPQVLEEAMECYKDPENHKVMVAAAMVEYEHYCQYTRVEEIIEFAKQHQDMKFLVTRIGCGIAGFKEEDIAPLFRSAVLEKNIYLPQGFFNIIMTPYIEH